MASPLLNSYEAKAVIDQMTIERIEGKWGKIRDLVKLNQYDEAKRQLYLLLHGRDMLSYWQKLCRSSDKIPQIWSYVHRFDFDPGEQTASINLRSGAVKFGPTFFYEQLVELADAMFLVIHERNHNVLNKLWANELSISPRRNAEHLIPTRLPPGIYNVFEDAYINVASRKMVYSSLPEKYYIVQNSMTKMLSGDVKGTIDFFTTFVGSLGDWSKGGNDYYYYGYSYGAPQKPLTLIEISTKLLRKYVAMYASSEYLSQKLDIKATMAKLNIEPTIGYHQVTYVEWMRLCAEWYHTLDDGRKAALMLSIRALPLIGDSSHALAELAERAEQVKHNVKLPVGMTKDQAQEELRKLYDLNKKRKELERKMKEAREKATDDELEDRINRDRQRLEAGAGQESPQEGKPPLPPMGQTDPVEPEEAEDDLEENIEEDDDSIEDRIAQDRAKLEGSEGDEDDESESDEPKHPWDVSGEEDEDGERDGPINSSLYYDEDGDEDLEEDLDGVNNQMKELAEKMGVDLDTYDGSRLDENIEFESSEAFDSYRAQYEYEHQADKLVKTLVYRDDTLYDRPPGYGYHPNRSMSGAGKLAKGVEQVEVRGSKIHEISPEGFEIQLFLATTEPNEIDTPRGLTSGVFNKFNQTVTNEIVGDILSRRVTETFVQGQVLIPPNQIARRDMFWLSAGVTPYFFTSQYSTTRQRVALYFDVSGSMFAYLPYIPFFAKRLAEYAGQVFQFSNVVVEVDPYDPYYYSTGGTSFNQVALHILEHNFKSVIILSDGEDNLHPKLTAKLKTQLEECYYLRTGFSGWRKGHKQRFNADFEPFATKIYPLFDYSPSEEDLKKMGIDPEDFEKVIK